MAKYTEDQLVSWTKPPSDSEQTKLENSERMVRDAINSDEKLKKKSTETFGQGSYANNTNVRLNSDIDINVRYTGGYYFNLPPDVTEEDVNIAHIESSGYSYSEFKDDVETALVNKFGRSEVVRNDKCITVKANTNRIETDVVPTWNFRRYSKNGSYVLGAKFWSDKGKATVNYPKQHIENGVNKNSNTYRRFKRLTRLHRKLRYKMIDDGENVSDNITSFLLECLVWNVPNRIMNDNDSWTERLKESIVYIYEQTKDEETCKEWGEVSELLYLFVGRKWTYQDVNSYMVLLWNHLEY
ncbi:nucleotidyltransferase [Reichenbachiella agarivorans]|uniref:Nucleotidyltransferase n=1 Tax=Reichenbachiella agarivorans TaxID=2979464 RepID=A0ABY6CNJ4_9BACT|nr:nucleotidyltransferase [Reichenbachiella agarivorans]UXP32088.1 nucleotidyltransferase [Reichenbachiella agarivorans]